MPAGPRLFLLPKVKAVILTLLQPFLLHTHLHLTHTHTHIPLSHTHIHTPLSHTHIQTHTPLTHTHLHHTHTHTHTPHHHTHTHTSLHHKHSGPGARALCHRHTLCLPHSLGHPQSSPTVSRACLPFLTGAPVPTASPSPTPAELISESGSLTAGVLATQPFLLLF